MMGLTRRQHDAFEFIASYIDAHGIAPSFTEIGDGLKLKSKSSVNRLVDGLVKREYVRRIPNRARAMEIVQSARPVHLRPELEGPVARAAAEDRISRDTFINEAVRAYLGEAA